MPASIVRQLAIGDQVDLAGRRLRILDVQDGERKVVRATPVQVETAKELLWLGSGPPVSWEVAQAVQQVPQERRCNPGRHPAAGIVCAPACPVATPATTVSAPCGAAEWVEVSRTPQGLYRYATYLGSLGNLMLQRTITAYYESRLEDMSCTSDALAVECTHPIDLQAVPLPVGREAFTTWVAQHLQALRRSCRSIPSAGPCPGPCWWPRSQTGSGTNGCRKRSHAIVSSRVPSYRGTHVTWSGTRR